MFVHSGAQTVNAVTWLYPDVLHLTKFSDAGDVCKWKTTVTAPIHLLALSIWNFLADNRSLCTEANSNSLQELERIEAVKSKFNGLHAKFFNKICKRYMKNRLLEGNLQFWAQPCRPHCLSVRSRSTAMLDGLRLVEARHVSLLRELKNTKCLMPLGLMLLCTNICRVRPVVAWAITACKFRYIHNVHCINDIYLLPPPRRLCSRRILRVCMLCVCVWKLSQKVMNKFCREAERRFWWWSGFFRGSWIIFEVLYS